MRLPFRCSRSLSLLSQCKGQSLTCHEQKWTPGAASAGTGATGTAAGAGGAEEHHGPPLYVQEVCLYRSEERGLPVLFVLTSQNDLFLYKSVHSGADDHVLPLRFRRMPTEFVTRSYADLKAPPIFGNPSAGSKQEGVAPPEEGELEGEVAVLAERDALPYSRQLIIFNNVCGRKGVFVRGQSRSGWCFFSSREYVDSFLAHNVFGEGEGINAFTPFHYQSCRRGFITVSSDNKLRIAQLRLGSGPDRNGDIDSGWVIRKTSLRTPKDLEDGVDVTPFLIDYHAPSTHFVVGSMTFRETEAPTPLVLPGQDPKSVVGLRLPVPEEVWRLSLHKAGTMKQGSSFPLESGEQILCLKVLSLSRGDDKEGRADNQAFGTLHLSRKPYVVVGTGFVKDGEDVVGEPCTGNIRIFALVPSTDPGSPFTLKLLIKDYVKGPVTTVSEMLGYLIYNVGPKTMMTLMGIQENVLVGKGFFDGQVYTTSVNCLKNFIVFTDQYRSMYFLGWKEDVRQLQLLGKDYQQGKLIDSNIVVDYDFMAMVGFDEDGNIRAFKYDPGNTKTQNGHQLVICAEYFLDSLVSCVSRVSLHSLTANTLYNQQFYKRNGLVTTCVDGSIHVLQPIQEIDYRRLQLLAVHMNFAVSHTLGCNPMDYRTFKSFYSSSSNVGLSDADNNPPIDLAIVYDFVNMPASKRRGIARKIGTHQRYIYKNLLEIQYTSALF